MTAAFEALADPTRRRIVELVADRERTAGDIAGQFSISRPGVSRHLRVLRENGLVDVRDDGTRRLYSLADGAFDDVVEWLRRFWTNRLDALETELKRGSR